MSNHVVCRGVRGATSVEADSREAILTATRQLLALMIRRNNIAAEDVGSAIFTVTRDLRTPNLLVSPILNLASVYANAGRTDESLELAREGLELARSVDSPQDVAMARILIADGKFKNGEIATAASDYESLVAIHEAPGGIPMIGAVRHVEGLWMCAGHFRNGITIAPASACLSRNIILGEPPCVDPGPYDPALRMRST